MHGDRCQALFVDVNGHLCTVADFTGNLSMTQLVHRIAAANKRGDVKAVTGVDAGVEVLLVDRVQGPLVNVTLLHLLQLHRRGAVGNALDGVIHDFHFLAAHASHDSAGGTDGIVLVTRLRNDKDAIVLLKLSITLFNKSEESGRLADGFHIS